LAVNRVRHSLTNSRIVEWRPLRVHVETDEARGRRVDDVDFRIGCKPVGFDGRERMDGVHLARLERGDPGGLVEDDSELDGLDLWSAGPVAIERLEDKPLTGHPLDELVRPRAHRMQ